MTNVLILNGSPRGKDGNTAKLVDRFVEGMKKGGCDYSFEHVFLKDKEINSCTGCYSCWKETPGECVFDDDMEDVLPKYIDADLIIWATPLYHFGMTSIMKQFIERTLIVNKPKIIEVEDGYSHPRRYDLGDKQNILISTCGFPEHSNFEVLTKQFERITEGKLNEKILSVMGELLSIEIMREEVGWYLEAAEKAGEEFAIEGSFSEETKETLGKKLISPEDYVELANASWEQGGPPRE